MTVKRGNYCVLLGKSEFIGKSVTLILRGASHYSINGFIYEDSVEGNLVKLYESAKEGKVKAIVNCKEIRQVITG